MIILELRDRKQYGPISKDEAIDQIMKDEKVPEWINIYFSRMESNKSIIGCELSDRYFANENELMYQEEGLPPFRVGYPCLPEKFQGKRFSIKDLKNM